MTDKKDSKTKYIQLKGELHWCKVFPSNRDKQGPNGVWAKHGGATCIDIHLDEDNAKILKSSGSQKKLDKKDGKGRYIVKIVRKWEAPFTYGGAPQVAHADGSPWDIDTDGLIGNGSTGIVYASVYPTPNGTGTRLDAVQVINHIPYESDGDFTPGVRFKDYSTGDDSPKAKPKSEKVDLPFEDEVPF